MCCIDCPTDKPSQLWDEILKLYPKPAFKYKSIYNLHIKEHQSRWRFDNDELESAKKLIEHFTGHEKYELEKITLPHKPADGCIAIAFALPTLICQWKPWVREVGLDSTCTFSLFTRIYVLIYYSQNDTLWI